MRELSIDEEWTKFMPSMKELQELNDISSSLWRMLRSLAQIKNKSNGDVSMNNVQILEGIFML